MKRRHLLQLGGLTAAELFISGCSARQSVLTQPLNRQPDRAHKSPLGPIVANPGRLLELPKGFTFTIIQQAGDPLASGFQMPEQPDGMCCFEDSNGHWVLLRNHELGTEAECAKYGYSTLAFPLNQFPTPRYRDQVYGGVTRTVLDPAALAKDFQSGTGRRSKAVVRSNLVLAGTHQNCAGGMIGNTWVTCEESTLPGHGYAFITRPSDTTLVAPRRIQSWGRFVREAVAMDPKTGVVYMTEDHTNGCLYRHVPTDPKQPFGDGKLQALQLKGVPHADPYPKPVNGVPGAGIWRQGQTWTTQWVDIPDPQAATLPCRKQGKAAGATLFRRNEGITWDNGSAWFISSLGGPVKAGQIFKLTPSTNTLTLAYEVTDRRVISCPDNLVASPWGDIVMAEDNYARGGGANNQYIRCLTRKGQIYDLARNPKPGPGSKPGAEFSGVCFSPDGQVLFLNMQSPVNATIAIGGPWPTAHPQ